MHVEPPVLLTNNLTEQVMHWEDAEPFAYGGGREEGMEGGGNDKESASKLRSGNTHAPLLVCVDASSFTLLICLLHVCVRACVHAIVRF